MTSTTRTTRTTVRGAWAALLAVGLAAAVPALAADPPAGFDQPRDVPHGKVERITYPSKTLGFDRPATVYTPPGFDPKAATKYPVLYLLHGSGDDETGWQVKGGAAAILDNLYADPAAKTTPMIVVMPLGYAVKAGDKPPAAQEEKRAASRAFEPEVTADLIPYIDAHYPTLADATHRAIAGLSMGGGQSLRIGLSHPDLFAWVGCFSSRLAEPYPDPVAKTLADPVALNAKLKLLYVACGDKDKGFEPAKAFAAALKEKKVNVEWVQTGGAHEWPVWKRNLWEIGPKLFK